MSLYGKANARISGAGLPRPLDGVVGLTSAGLVAPDQASNQDNDTK